MPQQANIFALSDANWNLDRTMAPVTRSSSDNPDAPKVGDWVEVPFKGSGRLIGLSDPHPDTGAQFVLDYSKETNEIYVFDQETYA